MAYSSYGLHLDDVDVIVRLSLRTEVMEIGRGIITAVRGLMRSVKVKMDVVEIDLGKIRKDWDLPGHVLAEKLREIEHFQQENE